MHKLFAIAISFLFFCAFFYIKRHISAPYDVFEERTVISCVFIIKIRKQTQNHFQNFNLQQLVLSNFLIYYFLGQHFWQCYFEYHLLCLFLYITVRFTRACQYVYSYPRFMSKDSSYSNFYLQE